MKKNKLFHYSWRAALSVFLLLLMAAFLPSRWGNKTQESCKFKICVSDMGIHSEIIMPVQNEIFDWRIYLPLNKITRTANPDYKYLGFGWGERDFYMNPPSQIHLQISAGLKALFWLNPSVIRVEGHHKLPQAVKVKCFGINQQGYLNLVKFINNTFKLDHQGQKIRLSYDYPVNVSYFDAKGTYSIVRNCNNWTAEGLRSAEVNTPLWAGLSSAIMWHLENRCDRTN
jgi:uncharacterized protein (TIGR02117 family)